MEAKELVVGLGEVADSADLVEGSVVLVFQILRRHRSLATLDPPRTNLHHREEVEMAVKGLEEDSAEETALEEAR